MKILFFATNSFPFGKGEPLVANQINSFSREFDKIIIISSDVTNSLSYQLPENVEVYRVSFHLKPILKIVGLLNWNNKIIKDEIKFVKQNNKEAYSFAILKVMLNSYKIATRYKSIYKNIIQSQKLMNEELFFHSYWCTEAVVGFALLRNELPKASMYSRFHAYDLYVERHKPNYLPFRKLIISNLDKLFFISEQGLSYFKRLYGGLVDDNKLILNRLGVDHTIEYESQEKVNFKGIRIVTCSSLIKLKRIHLLIEALSLIDSIEIDWVHFGEGTLLDELKQLSIDKLDSKINISYTFFGFIENNDLQKYYHSNKVDLFINTSKYEGIPISIMEAFAYKIPCIATDVGGVSEIVNSENGYLLSVDFKINELKHCIESFVFLTNEEKMKKQEHAFLTWKLHYNGQRNYEELIKEILPSYQMCKRCIYDNKIYPSIRFDEEGICEVCHIYDDLQKKTVFKNDEGEKKLESLLSKIKSEGKNKEYDCILGVSGGVDSSYLAYLAKQWGLKPLILHVDNGWNSELAVQNIENILKVLDFNLYTHVIDWEEMRDMQLSFFKASVVDIDLPFDNAFMAILFQIAKKYKIKYILSGHNTVTEGWMPPNFTHYKLDTLNLKAIHKKFGTKKFGKFPIIGPLKIWIYSRWFKIEFASPLDFVEYNKSDVKKKLIDEMNWRDYGGKHYENNFTKFYQGYILPTKFHVDKRKAHLSTLICSNQITKEEALETIKLPAYKAEELVSDKEFFIKKMGLTMTQFEEIMNLPIKKHTDYPSYINVINKLRRLKKLLIPQKNS